MTGEQRLADLEARLSRLETLVSALVATLDGGERSVGAVSVVANAGAARDGGPATPLIPGTDVACTDDVLVRLARVPVPFVRRMVAQKVADAAKAERVSVVDVAFFERAATF
jgi:hypothetical protein